MRKGGSDPAALFSSCRARPDHDGSFLQRLHRFLRPHFETCRASALHEGAQSFARALKIAAVTSVLARVAVTGRRPNPWLPYLLGPPYLDRRFHGVAPLPAG